MSAPCSLKIGWSSNESYCGTHGRAAGWPCSVGAALTEAGTPCDARQRGDGTWYCATGPHRTRLCQVMGSTGMSPELVVRYLKVEREHRATEAAERRGRTGPNLLQIALLAVIFGLTVIVLIAATRWLVDASANMPTACSTWSSTQR